MSLEKFPSFFLNFSETDLSEKNDQLFSFRSFRLDVFERRLSNDEVTIPLTPKAFDVLVYLVRQSGHLVEKQELLNAVWPDAVVEEANLSRIIHTLRKLLGEDKNGNRFIETVATKGYRFVAEVEKLDPQRIESGQAGEFDSNLQKPVASFEEGSGEKASGGSVLSRFGLGAFIILLALVSMTASWHFLGSRTDNIEAHKLIPETRSGEALQLYKQGRFLVERRHKGDYEEALIHFDRAIGLDPNYANAYAGKADVKVVQFWGSSSHDDISQARTAVRRAIELEGANAYAHTVLCRILTTYDWDHQEAEKECRLAVELDPKDHEAQKELAFLLNSLGRENEALEAMDRAVAIAPTSFNKRSRGLILYHSRRYDDAIAQLEQVDQTDPNYRETSRWLIRSHQMKKDYQKAFECYIQMIEQSGASFEELATLRSGFEGDGWNAVLRHMEGNASLRTMFLAGTQAQLGETEKAFATLEEMYKRRAILLITSAREPTLDPIREDPRYTNLLKRIHLYGL